jgi:hypothetical protein
MQLRTATVNVSDNESFHKETPKVFANQSPKFLLGKRY